MKKFTSIFLAFLGIYWLVSFLQQGSFWSLTPALISFLTSFLLLSNYSSNLLDKLLISSLNSLVVTYSPPLSSSHSFKENEPVNF